MWKSEKKCANVGYYYWKMADKDKGKRDYSEFLAWLDGELTPLQRRYAVCYYTSKYTKYPVIMRTPHISEEYEQIIGWIRDFEKERGRVP